MIDQIERLGREVETAWKKEGYAQKAFSRIAFEALQRNKLHKAFTMEAFLKGFRKLKDLPKQLSPHNGFGHPPITLYRNDTLNFLIDIYFWVDPEIGIHSHGFQGAFTVLQGESFHCQYDFPIRENHRNQVFIGDLLLKETAFLKEGDIEEVIPGPKFIHEVWHISCPTISLVIRTLVWDDFQHTYLKPHFAFQYRNCTPLENKQSDTLIMLHRVKSPQEERFLEELISKAEPYEAVMYLKRYFEDTRDLKRAGKVLERIPKFRKWAPFLLEAFERLRKTRASWKGIHEESERFFLALLSTFTEKEEIFRLIEARYPKKPALTTLMEWLRKLSKQKRVPFQLNETALGVLELLLQGDGEKAICQKLSASYEVKNTHTFQQEIRTFCNQLRAIELLKPLMPSPKSPSKIQKVFLRKETMRSSGTNTSSCAGIRAQRSMENPIE